MTDFKKWFAARARNPDRIALEEAFNAGKQSALSLASGDVSLISEVKTQPTQNVKDDIISDLQSQFDTEGITEYASGDALIRLSDAIAAVEDNFALAQPAPSVPDVDALAQFIREIDGKHQLGAGALAERIVEWLAAAPETKPCGAQIGASVPVAALRPVIDWLRNGCDPMKAADELEMLTAAPEAKL